MKSLSENENAILESPTGTGKTLALLCSSITWLKTKLIEEEEMRKKKDEIEEEYRDCGYAVSQIERKRDLLNAENAAGDPASMHTPSASQ